MSEAHKSPSHSSTPSSSSAEERGLADQWIFAELSIGECFTFDHDTERGAPTVYRKTGRREYVLAAPVVKRIGSLSAPCTKVYDSRVPTGGEPEQDKAHGAALLPADPSAAVQTEPLPDSDQGMELLKALARVDGYIRATACDLDPDVKAILYKRISELYI